jgi:hypothetical protein
MSVAVFGSLVVVGYNSSKQAGLFGSGAWNSLRGFAYSNNGGSTFTDGGFVPAGTGQLVGDPSLSFDRIGNLYYASIGSDASGISRIFVSKSSSTPTSVTFASPVLVAGVLGGTAPFEDKEMLAVDTTGGSFDGRVYVAWSEFPNVFSSSAQVLFAASSSTAPLAFSPQSRSLRRARSIMALCRPWPGRRGLCDMGSIRLGDGGSPRINPHRQVNEWRRQFWQPRSV